MPGPKVAIFWLTTDYRDSEMVELLRKKHIDVYFLLTKKQEGEIKDLEKVLKKICKKCNPDGYDIKEKEIINKKDEFYKIRIIKFLSEIK